MKFFHLGWQCSFQEPKTSNKNPNTFHTWKAHCSCWSGLFKRILKHYRLLLLPLVESKSLLLKIPWTSDTGPGDNWARTNLKGSLSTNFQGSRRCQCKLPKKGSNSPTPRYDVYEIEPPTGHGNCEGAERHADLGSNQLDLKPTQGRGNSCLVLET